MNTSTTSLYSHQMELTLTCEALFWTRAWSLCALLFTKPFPSCLREIRNFSRGELVATCVPSRSVSLLDECVASQ